jgi:cysteinyl-tRNA synthetase
MRLHNSLTGEEQEFVPANDKVVKLYVCGVTPYAATHIGHALSYIVFDVLRRYLEYLGYQVKHAQNFTDVDEKIIWRSRELDISAEKLADQYIDEFFSSMDALGVQRAHFYPRATKEIPKIIDAIQGLIDRGYAYHVGGDVYFRVGKSEGYGKLSHRTLDGMIAGSRVQVDESKEHPMDFVLWRGAKIGEPSWSSPWGPGRPGWHIECSTMALTYLGETIDIHGGGQDLVFPHHENEIAQSEAYTGSVPFSRYWVHNGLLRLNEDKMSKSLGNLIPVEEALRRFGANALRLYFLSSHYRSPLNYSEDACSAMERSAERLQNALSHAQGEGEPLDAQPFQERFLMAMDNDLNTPMAIATLFDLAREINRSRKHGQNVNKAQDTMRLLGNILGLTFHGREAYRKDYGEAAPFIQMLLEIRVELRRTKQYDLADRIRETLIREGVVVEDTD